MTGHGHPFWWLLTLACLVWYTGVTAYVAWRGLREIRSMLRQLRSKAGEE